MFHLVPLSGKMVNLTHFSKTLGTGGKSKVISKCYAMVEKLSCDGMGAKVKNNFTFYCFYDFI